ncbi:hypothetical protein D3C77_408300 [compost metagenome]
MSDLMRIRRDVKQVKANQDDAALKDAREGVNAAKVALGELGQHGGTTKALITTNATSLTHHAWSGSSLLNRCSV